VKQCCLASWALGTGAASHARTPVRKLGGNIKLSFRLGRQLLTAAKVRTTDVEKNKKSS